MKTKVYFALPKEIPIEDIYLLCSGLKRGVCSYIGKRQHEIEVIANRSIFEPTDYKNYNYTSRLIEESELVVVPAEHYYNKEIQQQIATALSWERRVLVVHENDYEMLVN